MESSTRQLNKFYSRIRANLEDAKSEQDDRPNDEGELIINKPQEPFKCYDDVVEDRMYGQIRYEDFVNILNLYEKQQARVDLVDKPVTCDSTNKGSFNKLLLSRPGFHNSGSTDYLISKLNIADTNRASFLGGHSNYNLFKGEDILAIERLNNRKFIKECLDKAWHYLDTKRELHLAHSLINKAYECDPNFGDTIGCIAKCKETMDKVGEAIDLYEQALKNETLEDKSKVVNNYIQCLLNEGCKLYVKFKFKEAIQTLEKILKYQPCHQNALLHIGLSKNKLNENNYTFNVPVPRTSNTKD